MLSHGTQTILVCARALRPAKMRRQNYARSMVNGIVDCGKCGANACVVFDLTVFDGNVEVNANEDALALEINILDGKLWHCSVFALRSLRRIGCELSDALFRGVSCEFVYRQTATEKRSTNSHEIELRIREKHYSPFWAMYFTRSRTRQE